MCWREFVPACWRPGTVELLREVGLGARTDREGNSHNGSAIAWEG
jgi:p-hydroxybenzoate 3-monooxygenase